MISQLEALGFVNPYAFRTGPCDQCKETLQTYYIPESKSWICESCFYSVEENREFISLVNSMLSENTMATPTMESLLATIEALKAQVAQQSAETAALKAKSTANVLISDNSGNLTLKHRQLNPRSWAIPTKNAQGQAYFRGGDFPMTYTLSATGDKLILHEEIPITPAEAQLFHQSFVLQNMVVAKTKKADASTPTQAPPQAYVPPATATPAPAVQAPKAPASIAPTGFTKAQAQAEAQGLVDAGLASNLVEGIQMVETSRKISFKSLS